MSSIHKKYVRIVTMLCSKMTLKWLPNLKMTYKWFYPMMHGNVKNGRIPVPIPETDTKRVGNGQKRDSGGGAKGNAGETLVSIIGNTVLGT